MIVQTLVGGYANPPLLALDSADFDGTNDYMTRGAELTGAADSKSGILSMWLRIDGVGTDYYLHGSTTVGGTTPRFRLLLLPGGSNQITCLAENAAGASIMSFSTAAGYAASATWLHFLASWNLATTTINLYVNDASDITVTTAVDDALDYTLADWSIGARPDGSNKGDACLADVYFAPGQYLDFSVTSNRRKFISPGGKPVWLGADGALPTGTAPLVYQHLDNGEAVANFATNRGTGGDFTITGTLDTGSDSPSD